MAKLKLKNLSNIGDVLTNEELKSISGGTGRWVCYCTILKVDGNYYTSEIGSIFSESHCHEQCEMSFNRQSTGVSFTFNYIWVEGSGS